MWNVIDRLTLADSLDGKWVKAGIILKAVYRWTKEKRNTTRKGSSDWKRYTTLMDKLQQEIKRG